MRDLTIAADVAGVVRLAGLRLEAFTIGSGGARLDTALSAAAARARQAPTQDEVTAAVRRLYRRFGIDPTKTRPSSEALSRRVRRGDPFPRVNALVDVCNWCSMEGRLPFGLYDSDRIDGAIECRRGGTAESYEGIRKDAVHVEGRLVLADRLGAFGNPTSDSARTMINEASSNALVVVYAPVEVDAAVLHRTVETTEARIAEFVRPASVIRWSTDGPAPDAAGRRSAESV